MSPSSGEPRILTDRKRPDLPKRTVVTAGMPYGNKNLHFGHVGGVFVHADAYARFMRDRIGEENVIFVSGTDCYGSPIVADHAKKVKDGEFSGDLESFVQSNHEKQAEVLKSFSIALNCFAASSVEPYQTFHANLGKLILETLQANGHLEARSNPQFYDAKAEQFLNGRQVTGRCPIDGCRSESAYADECSLGHQYEPKDLQNPVSTLTGDEPELREVTNWYLPLEPFREPMIAWLDSLGEDHSWRDFAIRAVREYLEPPTIHINSEELEEHADLLDEFPPHQREEGRGKSEKLVFGSIEDQDIAKSKLADRRIRFRSGKTAVPFRLTGNLEWGLPAPELEGLSGLTFWVWPESLWAPISFTRALLHDRGDSQDAWKAWWCSPDAEIHQFIGEDNLFFYGLAEPAMFLGMQGKEFSIEPKEGDLQMPAIVANKHVLFLDKKASSSGKVKPPMAADLLEYYTSDQVRIHFLTMALDRRNGNFRPKPLDPAAQQGAPDPVVKDGNILTNALNQAARSCFYTVQKFYEGRLPEAEVSQAVLEESETAILDFEAAMAGHEFSTAIEAASKFIREINKRWTQEKPFQDDCDPAVRAQTLVDCFHMVKVATVLMHPIAPAGTEKIREQLQVGEELWDWKNIFESLTAIMEDPVLHSFKHLPPKVDFFEKLACQFEK